MATVNLGNIKFKWKGTYNGATAYTIDDVVEYNGSSYICKLASTGNLPTNTTYFDVMSQAGTNGTDLTTTLTTQGDIVYRDGSSLQRLGAGVAGQVLQTGGAGANPSWVDASVGISEADIWRFTTNITTAEIPLSGNWERADDPTSSYIGTGMTESSGVFTFPTTGLYWVKFAATGDASNTGYAIYSQGTNDNGSTWDNISYAQVGDGNGWYWFGDTSAFFNVTNTSTHKVRFSTSFNGTTLYGNTDVNYTYASFIRLGDSQ